ncbi:3-hydroxyacyl-CoA dehydrogenase/enoyl-CoA hydratase/3-hydroxybutyryl-CoA epimerase [Pseudomonas sp. PvR086]|jgi:3-hydroxyacyl-CoA dehydrogenase/enoyl-CoA hydratase/3-hydroxybutyryl-CoA epimerase|uniref:3-hydroxyacyl-CoA dehydrogenase NAD-binding domain-containing protein n=1 Tax=Pseudomonas TaxID=286 RepID=UPI000B361215|nr:MULTISPECIES: 3-hydroxyacyl-CoA dehydrogenase NAD-binding domain-containing protein [Pseudomonas]MBD9608362.1 enoyl-CoA hydratase/isomerase family protein [Pseudomonas sp. PDM08]MDR7105574.1 3-hydroxyacyl-CoA dehydrogenase/enoyl-CoA hydratase/3-hydroxybutyryl-CoA epimerase [Pseudomonas frederiksbergensis]PMY52277.1 3-hydroxyacyl-CoA dehydrogenase [Pseudomonas sp. FW305-53]PMY85130.1 3-hydroxyacyl-CoA dehydrogenase [Pseudomonas sp. FW303-C2]PMY91187.1 3-hydroxyacyl-CoA dehydrogenase [Pseudom
MTQAIRYEKGPDRIVVLTIDMPGQSANTMNAVYREAMATCVERLVADKDAIAGVIITSAKKTFFAGGDLNELIKVGKSEAQAFYNMVLTLKGQLRTLETLGKPVVAAINGAALGGGWEICLACHHRVALDNPSVLLGLPEVTLGLLPGGGGVVRMVRMLGIEKALPYLLEGKKIRPQQALQARLIDELAVDHDELMAKARAWIAAHPVAVQRWDVKGYQIPGGTPSDPKVMQMLAITPSILRSKTQGCLPAPEKILCAAVEGAQVDFDTAHLIETRYFTELTTGQVSKNLIGTFWFQLNEINAGGSRPQGIAPYVTKKVGVLGAGMMGAGIAFVSASAGIDVVLKDINLAAAEKGKAHSAALLDKKVARGQLSREQREAILTRIHTTENDADLAGCDLIIEAVFEDRELKARVSSAAQTVVGPDAVIASNTSTLPISGLATAVPDQSKFIGLHFFSPVEKMPLVEIIKGVHTSDETLTRGFDFVLQIKKTPIVVNDSRGFFTSRVFGTFTNEGIAMLGEGVSAPMIETEARKAGMPVGPLAISDEVSLSLMSHIRQQTAKDLQAEGKPLIEHPAFAVIDLLLKEFKRPGKAAGGGFYDYPAAGQKHLWPELKTRFEKAAGQISPKDVRDRLLFIQAIETVRCVEEGVLTSTADANVGSIFGIGFAAWTGGALQFINQYGVKDFVARAQYLAEQYGERFTPPALLLEKAAKDALF